MRRNRTTPSTASHMPANKKIETYKLVFELMKQLTALSSGSIILLITLVEKVFRTAPPSKLIALAFFGFCTSIIAAVVVMMLLAYNAADGQISESERNAFGIASAIASVAFVMGIVFTVFAAVPSFL